MRHKNPNTIWAKKWYWHQSRQKLVITSGLVDYFSSLQNVINVIGKCDKYFTTKCDRYFIANLVMLQIQYWLQNETILLQNATHITRLDSKNKHASCKVGQKSSYRKNLFSQIDLSEIFYVDWFSIESI